MAEPTHGDGTCWNTLRIKTLLFSHQDSFIAVLKRRWVGHSVIVERPLKSRGGGRAVDPEKGRVTGLVVNPQHAAESFQTVMGSKNHYVEKAVYLIRAWNIEWHFISMCMQNTIHLSVFPIILHNCIRCLKGSLSFAHDVKEFIMNQSGLLWLSLLLRRGLRCLWTGGGARSPGRHVRGPSVAGDSPLQFVLEKANVLGLMGM